MKYLVIKETDNVSMVSNNIPEGDGSSISVFGSLEVPTLPLNAISLLCALLQLLSMLFLD